MVRRSGRARSARAGAWSLLVALVLAWPVGLPANPGSRVTPGTEALADPGTLTVDERREFLERRAAVEARVDEFRQRLLAPCRNLRDAVRTALESVERVRAMDPGPALLTSDPPKFRVSYVVALTSGRYVGDEVVVEVPLDVRVVPVAGQPGRERLHPCGGTAPKD